MFNSLRRGMCLPWLNGHRKLPARVSFDAPPRGTMMNDCVHELLVHHIKAFGPVNYSNILTVTTLIAMQIRELALEDPEAGAVAHHTVYRRSKTTFTAACYSIIKSINMAPPDDLVHLERALRSAQEIGAMRIMHAIYCRQLGCRPQTKQQPKWKTTKGSVLTVDAMAAWKKVLDKKFTRCHGRRPKCFNPDCDTIACRPAVRKRAAEASARAAAAGGDGGHVAMEEDM